MQILFACSDADREFAAALAKELRKRDLIVWSGLDTITFGVTGSPMEIPKVGAVAVLVFISQSLVSSPDLQFSVWKVLQKVRKGQNIVPVRIDNSMIPSYLRDRPWIDMRDNLLSQEAITGLIKIIQSPNKVRTAGTPRDHGALADLNKELRHGNLALFCGAGISRAANLPDWDKLMQGLYVRLFEDDDSRGLVPLNSYLNKSPLVLGKFFQNATGRQFRTHLRDALYPAGENLHRNVPLLEAIAKLCAPPRTGAPLRSVITFNFDDLLEKLLQDHGFRFASIYDEGQRWEPEELPIFHVHGYLPQAADQATDHDLVFSEGAYHSQFIDPYSWANLVQLNHLHNCTCLLIGLSMKDPNLRRLLDVSNRKNSKKLQRHYVILARYKSERSGDPKLARLLEKRAQFVEEQDANQLGLNVIWVDSHKEIPSLISEIAGVPSRASRPSSARPRAPATL